MNIAQPTSDQDRFTAERVARTRPKTYRAVVRLLADPDAKIEHIAQRHRVSTHTVRAIREREAVAIAERKQRLMSIFANVAEISAERMEELAGHASLRDAGVSAGIATDKLLALAGEHALTIQHDLVLRPFNANDLYEKLNSLIPHNINSVIEARAAQPALPSREIVSDSGAETGQCAEKKT